MKKPLRFIPVVLLLSGAGFAQEVERETPSIRVTGEATLTARPDQAQIDLGVITQAKTAQDAAAQNANRLAEVLSALREKLGAKAKIETASYSLSPDYEYPREGGRPSISGYTATNVVRVTLSDLARVGETIDAAAQSGANTIHRIVFTLEDEAAVQSQVLQEAAREARRRAEALAEALGLRITRVLSVVEGEAVVRPIRDVMATRAEALSAPTPIEPGGIDVRASVTLTVEVSR